MGDELLNGFAAKSKTINFSNLLIEMPKLSNIIGFCWRQFQEFRVLINKIRLLIFLFTSEI